MIKNEKGRALLASAIIEDEGIRLASIENSKLYLRKKEDDDCTPFWMWCMLYFILGVLFTITLDNVSFGWEEFLSFFQVAMA